jgi:hypothetical protein
MRAPAWWVVEHPAMDLLLISSIADIVAKVYKHDKSDNVYKLDKAAKLPP